MLGWERKRTRELRGGDGRLRSKGGECTQPSNNYLNSTVSLSGTRYRVLRYGKRCRSRGTRRLLHCDILRARGDGCAGRMVDVQVFQSC